MRLLVLAGTGDGRAVAQTLRDAGHDVTESVAGRTAGARARDGVRVGGFGGAEGLAAWLTEHRIDAVVNATHPFAARMARHAADACAGARVPLGRWLRPSWAGRPDAEGWLWVPGHAEAARAASGRGRVLLTVGRQELDAYQALPDVVARVTEPVPGWTSPAGWELVVARGPFGVTEEETLMASRDVRVLVSKDAGGAATTAKLDAAAALGVGVIMVRRPESPPGVPVFSTLEELGAWLAACAPGEAEPG